MNLTITLGWWVIPAAVTIASLIWALVPRRSERRSGDYDFAFWIPAAFRLAVSIIVSLALWLTWSLTR